MEDAAILEYRQRCFSEYAKSVGLPEPYTYPDGNPIRTMPPLQTIRGGLMIVGAYPSARFESRPSQASPGRRRLVPVADNLQPFNYEQYFDGVRVRTLESGSGLREYLLSPLGLTIEQCWVTDLVKVFLYKPEHVDSCGDACPGVKIHELRTRFMALAGESLKWLAEECLLCRPRLVVTLGQEVAQVVSGERNATAADLLRRDVQRPSSIGYPTVYLPHPDACRRSEGWRGVMRGHVPLLRALLA